MTSREASIALDRLRDNGVRTLIISGGEPLLYDHIWDVLSYGKDLGFSMNMMTNGTLMDTRTADVLSTFNIPVWFSLDFFNEKAQRAWRRGGSFRGVYQFIEKSLVPSMSIGIRSTVMWSNVGDVKNIAGFCHRNKVPMVGMRVINCRAGRVWREPSQSDLKELYSFFGERGLMLEDPPFYLFRDASLDDVFNYQNGFVCEAMAGHRVSVDPAGNVFPCPFLSVPALRYGNLFVDDWSVIERGYSKLRSALLRAPDCGNRCWFAHQPFPESDSRYRLIKGCAGGCLARSYWRYHIETKTFPSLDQMDLVPRYDPSCPFYDGGV